MPRFIIQHEKHVFIGQEPLMLANGSLSFHGMKFLESMWREKESNKDQPFLHLLNGAYQINSKDTDVDVKGTFQECLEDSKHLLSSEKPTFFLFAEANLHWIPVIAYLENEKTHVFIFDPAPLNTFNWEDESAALDSESEEDIIYYRNETLFKEDKEISHLATDSGCGIFAFKWVHKLFFYKDLNLEALKNALSIKEASAYEKERGIGFSFPLPKPLAYLSHLRETYALVETQKKRMLPTALYNTTLEYFVEKAHTKLNDLIRKNESVLEILNQYIGENLAVITQAQAELVLFLKKEYQENPAVFKGTILPLAWEDFCKLPLSAEERGLACIEYYQNLYHSALRYLLGAEIWKTSKALNELSPWSQDIHPASDSLPITSDDTLHPPTKNLLPLMALLYWIAETKVEEIKGHPVALSKDELFNVLALFAREHNRDIACFTFSQAIDNLLPDSPAMFFEAQEALLCLVQGVPFKSLQEQIQEDLNEFMYQHIKSHVNFASVFKEILDSQRIPKTLSQFNLPAEKIENLILELKRKYKEDFAFDSEFFIRKQLALGPFENHFSKFYTPLFEGRYLEELKQNLISLKTECNSAHQLFNHYLEIPSCMYAVVKEVLNQVLSLENSLVLFLIAHLENNQDEKIAHFEKIKAMSDAQELGLFECSDSEIASAILQNKPALLLQSNRGIKAFISAHNDLLSKALECFSTSAEMTIDSEEPRPRVSFFSSPEAKRRRIADVYIENPQVYHFEL